MGLNIRQEPSATPWRTSNGPNLSTTQQGQAEPGSVSRPPRYPSGTTDIYKEHFPGRPATGERRPNSDKGFATKISNLPNPPNLPLHSQTHSPTQSSPCTLKCLQSNQLRTQKEAPTGSDGWLAGLTATFWDATTSAVCSPTPGQCSVPGNSGKKGEAMAAPLEPKSKQGDRYPA